MVYLNVIQCNLCETSLCLSPYEVNNLICDKCLIIDCYLKPKYYEERLLIRLRKNAWGVDDQNYNLDSAIVDMIIFKLIVTIVEILFILHVINGIHITIQVYLHEFIYKY